MMDREQAAEYYERLSVFPFRHAANLRRARLSKQADIVLRQAQRYVKCARRLRGQEY